MNLGFLSLCLGLGLLAAAAAGAALLYAADYGLEATVVGKDCGDGTGFIPLGAPSVRVRTKLAGLLHTQELPAQQCALVDVGNFVVYHVRSGRMSLYESEGGACIYDSVGGARGCPSG